jgi:hypothetical protein
MALNIGYRIEATLKGVNGVKLRVTTIWMLTNQNPRFITLVPIGRVAQE